MNDRHRRVLVELAERGVECVALLAGDAKRLEIATRGWMRMSQWDVSRFLRAGLNDLGVGGREK